MKICLSICMFQLISETLFNADFDGSFILIADVDELLVE